MPFGAFASFAALDFLLVMTPGADWAFAITAGVRRDGMIAAIAGLLFGYMVQAALVATGLGAVLARDNQVLGAITFVGAAYLLILGISVMRRQAPITAAPDCATRSSIRNGLRGAAVSGLNPKGLLLFFAVLPQFVVTSAAWPVSTQLAALGSFHIAACAIVYLTVAVTASRLLSSRPQAASLAGRISGATMILVALALILDRILGG